MGQDNGRRPLVLIDDEALLDEVLRLAAAAGCDLQRMPDITDARARWIGAPLIVLDERHARECQRAGLPRREGVLLVCGPGVAEPSTALWQRAVAIGAGGVVCLPSEETALVTALSDAVDAPNPATGSVLAVVGGRGGAGASVLVAAVGVTVLRNGGSALLVDCDPAGAGLDLVLGAEADSGLRWPELRVSSGRVPALSLHSALPGREHGTGRLAVVSCGREGPGPSAEAVAAVVESGKRAGDVVVCDLPRDLDSGLGAPWAAVDRADLTVLVVPAEVRACASARRIANQLHGRGAEVGLVVRGPAPGGLTGNEVCAAVGAPQIDWLRPENALAKDVEYGGFRPRQRGPLDTAARKILAAAPARGATMDAAGAARAA